MLYESEYQKFVRNAAAYMVIGDIDKDFHLPECECGRCEEWRRRKGRPTHEALRMMKAKRQE